jgi:hypothetical protein
MKKVLWGVVLSAAWLCGAFAQAPAAPAAPTASPAGARDAASAAVPTEVRSTDLRDQGATNTNRAPSTSPGRGYAPMNIRLQDGGVKMPKCAEESREGMACK